MGAQSGFTLIVASQIYGTLLGEPFTGIIEFTPVNNLDRPIWFRTGGTHPGQMSRVKARFPVVDGEIQSDGTMVDGVAIEPQLPDVSLTYPQNLGYRVKLYDPITGENLLGPGAIIQPSGAVFDLDTFDQDQPLLATQQTGPMGPAGPVLFVTSSGTIPALLSAAVDVITGQPGTITVADGEVIFTPAGTSVAGGILLDTVSHVYKQLAVDALGELVLNVIASGGMPGAVCLIDQDGSGNQWLFTLVGDTLEMTETSGNSAAVSSLTLFNPAGEAFTFAVYAGTRTLTPQ